MRIQITLKLVVMMLVILLSGSSQTIADDQLDYCIKCTNPDQIYICKVTSNGTQTRGMQFFCIINIAREYGHDSCAAAAQPSSCSGVLVQYDVSASAAPQMPSEEASTIEPPISQPAARDRRNGEPRTLVEFTKQASRATKKGLVSAGHGTGKVIKNTGKAIKKTGKKIEKFSKSVANNIKNATTTTLKCIASLFFNCGDK